MNYLLANRIIFIGKPIYDTVRSFVKHEPFLVRCGSHLLPFCRRLLQVAQYVCSAMMALELANPNEDIMVRS